MNVLKSGLLRLVALALVSLSCEASKLEPTPPSPPAPPWQDLLAGVTADSLSNWKKCGFGGEGEVLFDDGRLVLAQGEPLTGITWAGSPEMPRGEYEIEVEAARLLGTDFFCALTFPIGEQSASVILGGWGGSLVGLSCIDGEDASQNATKTFRGFERERFYRLRVKVTNDRVQGVLDDTDVLFDVDRRAHAFAVRTEVERCRPLGIASYNTRAAIRRLAWRPLRSDSPK